MEQPLFWVWTGWGLFFTFIIGVWQFLMILVSVYLRGFYSLRNVFTALILLPALILTFVTSGWIAGLLSIIIGPIIGLVLAKLFLPKP